MTIDALRAGLDVREVELELEHRATGRDAAGFVHRGRQLRDLLLATLAPQGGSFRGLRLPLVGGVVGLVVPSVAPVAAIGLADDLWSGPERGFRAHLRAGATTGTLKLVGIPLWALWRTRSLSGAVLVGLSANLLNQLDTRPGRALKAFLVGSVVARRAAAPCDGRVAVLLAPYDLREMTMLGDAGSNALGAVLGLESVRRLTGLRRMGAIVALAAVTLVGERRSLGALIESTPGLRALTRRRWDRRSRERRAADPLRLRHGRGRLGPRQGNRRRVARPAAEGARAPRPGAEVRPVPQRRPGHDEPVPARRGLRHRGRRRDRPRPRALRAVHRREPLAEREPLAPARSGTRCSARSGRASSSARPSR